MKPHKEILLHPCTGENVAPMIDKSGFINMMIGSMNTAEKDRYSYTIGFWHKGFPEVVVTGRVSNNPKQIHPSTWECYWEFEKNGFKEGLNHNILTIPVKFVRVNTIQACENHTCLAENYWMGHNFDVVQMLYPDQYGKFPDEFGYDHANLPQPLIYRSH